MRDGGPSPRALDGRAAQGLAVTDFSQFGLNPTILKALAGEGYAQPTPIQTQAIAPLMEGRDLLGLAQTGTGKTAAFALPILHRLAGERRFAGPRAVRCLVLAPTRELAAQICDSFRAYGRGLGVSAQVVFGGVPIGKQIRALERGVDVLVATPGRLLDLVQNRAVRFENCEILVLDEADHMLDIGFIVPIRRIVKMIPSRRQSALFSATMPAEIRGLASEILHEPVEIAVTPTASTAQRVRQSVIFCEQGRKQDLLAHLAADTAMERVIVFVRMKHQADRVVARLDEAGIDAVAIHGNKSQGQRTRALEAFKNGDVRLLVATDIAARGIDVDAVTHVVNYDLPDVPEAYVHRIGRTARAGLDGVAISFCAREERGSLKDIERLIRQRVFVEAHPLGDAVGPDPDRSDRGAARTPRGARPGHGALRTAGGPGGQGRDQQHRRERPPASQDGARQTRGPQDRSANGQPSRDHVRQDRAGHDSPRRDGARHGGPRHDRSAPEKPAPGRPAQAGSTHDRRRQDRPGHDNFGDDRFERRDGGAQRPDSGAHDAKRDPQRRPGRSHGETQAERSAEAGARVRRDLRDDRAAPRGRAGVWSNQEEPPAGVRSPRRGAGRPR